MPFAINDHITRRPQGRTVTGILLGRRHQNSIIISTTIEFDHFQTLNPEEYLQRDDSEKISKELSLVQAKQHPEFLDTFADQQFIGWYSTHDSAQSTMFHINYIKKFDASEFNNSEYVFLHYNQEAAQIRLFRLKEQKFEPIEFSVSSDPS